MILFKPEHADMILSGQKTMTRRIWKKNRAVVGSIHQARTQLYGKPFAYLKIIKRFDERLGNISDEDVIKEGYNSFNSFYEIWEKINGSWDYNQIVRVVEFEVIKK